MPVFGVSHSYLGSRHDKVHGISNLISSRNGVLSNLPGLFQDIRPNAQRRGQNIFSYQRNLSNQTKRLMGQELCMGGLKKAHRFSREFFHTPKGGQ